MTRISAYLTNEVFIGIREKFLTRYKHHHHNSGIWGFLYDFKPVSGEIRRDITSGTWRMEPFRLWVREKGENVPVSSFRDRAVIHIVWTVLDKLITPHLPDNYYKKKGKGPKKAINDLSSNLKTHKYVFKTDVKSYFASIDHDLLLKKISRYVKSRTILALINQIIKNYVEYKGVYKRNLVKGIPLGVSTSCIFGALYLKELDEYFQDKKDMYYQRFVDDIIVLTKTKHQQKRAMKAIYQILRKHKMTTRYEKTFRGKTSDTIVYLGRKIKNGKLGVSNRSMKKMRQRLVRLYEQGATEKELRTYINRWRGSMFGRKMDLVFKARRKDNLMK